MLLVLLELYVDKWQTPVVLSITDPQKRNVIPQLIYQPNLPNKKQLPIVSDMLIKLRSAGGAEGVGVEVGWLVGDP